MEGDYVMKEQHVKESWIKRFKMPHAYVIITILLIVISLLTYVIPAGSYERIEDAATGRTIVDPASYEYTEANPVSLLKIPSLIVKSIGNQNVLIFSIIIIAGSLEIILGTGMFHAFCNKLSQFSSKKGREKYFIPSIVLIFTILGLTQSTDKFIGFAPIGVMLALALGYDAIVGIAMILLGVGISFSVGPMHTTTALAQEIAGLPLYSGLWFRLILTVIFYIVTVWYISNYAKKIKLDPTKSHVYGLEDVISFDPSEANIEVDKKHYGVLAIFTIAIGLLMYGCIKHGWGFGETSILFIWTSVICGLFYGLGPSQISKLFIKGANGATGAALVVGLGATVSLILNSAGVIDTVVMSMAGVLSKFPHFLMGPLMYVTNTIINFFIPSGMGQAAVVMPILAPLSDVVGVTRQTAVLSYKLGDGLSNYIFPHAAALMGFLGVTGIPYDKWMKFMAKLMVIWFVISFIACGVANIIGYM